MDKQLMKKFYQQMYEDIVSEVVNNNYLYQEQKNQYVERRSAFGKKLKDLDEEMYTEYEELENLFGSMNSIVYMELYIKGAEDREAMLR